MTEEEAQIIVEDLPNLPNGEAKRGLMHKLKKVLSLPQDIMEQVVDDNIREDREFIEQAKAEAKERLRKNAAAQNGTNQCQEA